MFLSLMGLIFSITFQNFLDRQTIFVLNYLSINTIIDSNLFIVSSIERATKFNERKL